MSRTTEASITVGRATSGQVDAYVSPLFQAPARRPVIYHASGGMNASEIWGPVQQLPDIATLVRAIVMEGIQVVAPTATNQWGNATSRSRTSDARTWAATLGANTDKVVLMGASQGVPCALNWAQANPTLVAGIVGIIPAIDLEAIRASNVNSLRASIDAAWGVSYPTALPANANPMDYADELTSIPIQLFFSNDDGVSENVDTFALATGAELVDLGALGHTNAAVAAVDTGEVLDFIRGLL